MEKLYPIIRRKRRPLIVVESVPDGPPTGAHGVTRPTVGGAGRPWSRRTTGRVSGCNRSTEQRFKQSFTAARGRGGKSNDDKTTSGLDA